MFRLLILVFQLLVSPANIKELALENLALRQQLAVMKRQRPRPRLRRAERWFWVWLSRVWSNWRRPLLIVRPETVVGWHRRGFRLYWTWISRRRQAGRPGVNPEVKDLIRKMAEANPLWGAPRMHGELLKLGIEVSERTVSRLMPKNRKPPSQTWKAFLNNHVQDLVSVDFFTVPTVSFRVLFVFVVLAHHRRQVLHFNVTERPTAGWTGQQMVEAFPEDTAPRYLLRDRDKIYGEHFHNRVQGMGIREVKIAPQSPWQSPFVERLVGSVRRECLDHVIVLGEKHLRRILKSYFDYYLCSRTHLSLAKDAPTTRVVQGPGAGQIVEIPQVGGLHHRYERRAA
jgi:putative transposase